MRIETLSCLYDSLTDEERLELLREILVAASIGPEKVTEAIEAYLLDFQVRRDLDTLVESG